MSKLRNYGSLSDHKFSLTKGDIFATSLDLVNSKNNGYTVIIPHVCNNIGVFGAGFSGEIERKFPEVAINFNIGGKIKLGNTQFITVAENHLNKNKLIIANMVAQNGTIGPKNRRPLHYPSLIRCMFNVLDLVNSMNKTEKGVKIFSPKFGSGLAGGNWNFIADLIDDIWSTHDVMVFTKQ
jgi:hypothetical protein